jgi:hypothetical protein
MILHGVVDLLVEKNRLSREIAGTDDVGLDVKLFSSS